MVCIHTKTTTNEEQQICLVVLTSIHLMWPFILKYFFLIITGISINIVANGKYVCICVNDPFKGEQGKRQHQVQHARKISSVSRSLLWSGRKGTWSDMRMITGWIVFSGIISLTFPQHPASIRRFGPGFDVAAGFCNDSLWGFCSGRKQ